MMSLGDALSSAFVGEGLNNQGLVRTVTDLAIIRMVARLRAAGAFDAGIDRATDAAREAIAEGLDLCESPIERTLLPAIVCADYGFDLAMPTAVHVTREEPLPNRIVTLVPQAEMHGRRLDFALVLRAGGLPHVFAIECDGEAYHNGKRDRTRDRVLTSWGVVTVRATGAEIMDDAVGVADRIAAMCLAVLDSRGVRL